MIVGNLESPGNLPRPFRWTVTGGTQEIPNPFASGLPPVYMQGCSADGSIAYGSVQGHTAQSRVFRWAASTGSQLLNTLEHEYLTAHVVSDDGSTIAGLYDANLVPTVRLFYLDIQPTGVGSRYGFPAVANSTGGPASIYLDGSDQISANDLTLSARELPANTFGYFLRGTTHNFAPTVTGSQGALLLGGLFYRYNALAEIGVAGPTGQIALALNLSGAGHRHLACDLRFHLVLSGLVSGFEPRPDVELYRCG